MEDKWEINRKVLKELGEKLTAVFPQEANQYGYNSIRANGFCKITTEPDPYWIEFNVCSADTLELTDDDSFLLDVSFQVSSQGHIGSISTDVDTQTFPEDPKGRDARVYRTVAELLDSDIFMGVLYTSAYLAVKALEKYDAFNKI